MSFSLLNFWLLLPTAGLFFFNHGGRAIVRSVGKALPSSCSQGHNALTLGHFAVFPSLSQSWRKAVHPQIRDLETET